jgi:hypothetical protein
LGGHVRSLLHLKITRFAMKLKAPQGVGDPCVVGVTIAPRDGCYEVEAEIAALLIECFGFVAIDAAANGRGVRAGAPRRGRAAAKKPAAEE